MLSKEIQSLVEKLKSDARHKHDLSSDGAFIKVNRLATRAGAFYEKIRYFVDYKEEHTIRRAAIERIVRRKVMLESDKNVGLSLLQELVHGGYLPNDAISESVADDVQKILNRFLLVKEYIGSKL